jgi:OmpA-OmpF porin, OOP family
MVVALIAPASAFQSKRRETISMKNSKRAASALLGMLALAATTTSVAVDSLEQRTGVYMGVSMGNARYPKDASLDFDDVVLKTLNPDSQSFAWAATLGYRPTKYFGAEVGWVDLGKAESRLVNASGTTLSSGKLEYGVKGPTAAFVGFLPFGYWDATVKLGVLFPDVDLKVEGTDGVTPFVARETSDSTHSFWGVGLGYHISDRLKLKVGLDHFSDVGDRTSTGRANINMATFGVEARF